MEQDVVDDPLLEVFHLIGFVATDDFKIELHRVEHREFKFAIGPKMARNVGIGIADRHRFGGAPLQNGVEGLRHEDDVDGHRGGFLISAK